jgi:type II/III secretion system protein
MKNPIAAVMTVMLIALAAPAWAQDQRPTVAPIPGSTIKVQLVVSRFQGEKKVSSLPYNMMVHVDERNRNTGRATLRLGTQVPITTMVKQGNDANAQMVPSVQYRDVGTSIDLTATAIDEGRFKLDISVEDSSVDAGPASGANASHPAFRSFRTSDAITLRDGQSAQSFTATDKVSGDVWKVDVTLTVVK